MGVVLIKSGDGDNVRIIYFVDEIVAGLHQLLQVAQGELVDGLVIVHVDGAGHAADQEVRVRVLAAQNGVDLDHVPLPDQGLEVMRHAQQIHFRRQLVGRMAPVAVREDGILPVGDGVLQLFLHSGEIRGGGQGPVGKGFGDGGGFRGVRLQGGHHVHPVHGLELVKMDDVVLDAQGPADQVAHEAGLDGHRVLERVFHRGQGRDGVRARADAADAFHESPDVTGSRLQAITSMPRYCVVDVQAFLMTPSPASISTRRWPSMRVTGSMTTRLDSGTSADV